MKYKLILFLLPMFPLLMKGQIYPFYDSEFKKFGYVDSALNFVIKPIYKDAFPFQNDTAVVQISAGKFELINAKGAVLKSLVYNSLDGPFKNLIVTQIGLKIGIIDLAGRTILKNSYSEVKIEDGNDTIIAKKSGSASYFLYNGKLIRTVKTEADEMPKLDELTFVDSHDKITYVYNDTFPRVVEQKGKFGYINENNNLLFGCQFTLAAPFYNRVAKIHRNFYKGASTQKLINGVLHANEAEVSLVRVYVLDNGKELYRYNK